MNPVGLIKVGKREHIRRLLSLGELHMQPLRRYATLENDPNRGDLYEGTSYIWQPDVAQLQVMVAGRYETIPGIAGPLRYSSDRHLNTTVYCMYAISELDSPTFFDERNAGFGEWFAYVTHVDEFLRRVSEKAPSGTLVRSGLVEYVDSSLYTGPMEAFRKRREFSHQNEFRITLEPGTGDVRKVYLGDLSDVVIVGKVEQVTGRRVRAVAG